MNASVRGALAALAVVSAAVSWTLPATAPAAHAASCTATNETRNTWHRIASPRQGAVVAVADADACSLVAAAGTDVWTSDDGGGSWQRQGDLPGPVVSLVRHGLPNDVVVAVPRARGLLVSRDAGRTWSSASGLSDVQVAAVAADPADRTSVWAAGVHGSNVAGRITSLPSGSIFHSTDAAASWNEDAGGLPLQPHVVARVGAPYLSVFTDDQRTGGLWRRTDAGAFTRVYDGRVAAIATGRIGGGGSQVFVAGAGGVAASRDGGDSFVSLVSDTAATAVAPEAAHFTAFDYLSNGRPYRSTDSGRHHHAIDAGLPASCRAESLTSDGTDPSTFLTACADGSTWRWRSDGSDLSDVDLVGRTGGPDLLGGLPQSQPMQLLGTRDLPNGQGTSASIAFDGDYLYYATSTDRGRVHRIRSSDGRRVPDLVLPGVTQGILSMTYDSVRHMLYFADRHTVVRSVNLRTGGIHKLFSGKLYYPSYDPEQSPPTGSMSYDASLDQFVFINDQASEVDWFHRNGSPARSCNLASTTVGAEAFGTTNLAAIIASGDGQLYAESEDDSTVYRVDSACSITAGYVHRPMSEAPDENDAMTCDTVTFSEPAIWMRDAEVGRAYAYAIPDGYCALATQISVSAPARVTTGSAGTVCARLIRTGTRKPVHAVPVDLLVANRLVGRVRTNTTGRACADYVPTAAEAGRVSTVARSRTTSARQPVVGAFLGTRAYRPASARATLATIDFGIGKHAPPPPPIPVAPAAVPPPPPPAAPPPIAVAPPPPPVPPAPQVQPVPQAHPGAQPGGQPMGQVGLAPQPDAEAAAAAADNRDEFRAREEARPTADLRVLVPAGLLLAVLATRRRAASRVRGQPS